MDRPQIYLGNNTILTKLIHGPKIYVDTRDISVAPHIILDGYWEQWISNEFLSSVKKGMTVLDIGANCGYYSLLAAMNVGKTGYVHSFEPNPIHHKNLENSFSINGYNHAKLHKVAVTDIESEITLHIPKNLTGSASIHDFDYIDNVSKIKVRSINIDNYLPNLKADVIKIDIEGSEPYIMDGLFKIVERSKNMDIFLEYNPISWINNNFDPETILNRFLNNGFNFKLCTHDKGLIPIDIKDLTLKSFSEHLDLKLERRL